MARDDNDLLVALARPLGEFDDARLPGTENVLVACVRINVENVGRLKRVVVALEFEQRDGAELIAVTGEVAYIANFEDKVGYDRDARAAELSPLLWEGNLQLPDGAVVQTCSGFGCGKRESRPHEFERCGRCRRAVYCSRECQRKNWKAFHKGVCSRFVEIAPLARPLRVRGAGGT